MNQVIVKVLEFLEPRNWLVVFLAIILIGFGAYFFYAYDVRYDKEHGLSIEPKGPTPEQPIGHINYRGFYVDFEYDDKGTRSYFPAFEDLSIDFYPSNKISGMSRGESRNRGQTTKKDWQITGFYIGDFFFLSYVTKKDDGNDTLSPGAGVYILVRRFTNFSGQIIFRDAANNLTMKCPYVLTTELSLAADAAKVRWDQLHQKCEEVHFDTPS